MTVHATIFKQIISDLGITHTRIELPVKTNRDFPDLGLRSSLYGADTPFADTIPQLDPNQEKQPIMMLRDQFRCNYFLGFSPDRDQLWLIGPYVHKTLTLAEINHIFTRIGIGHPDLMYLQMYYHSLPTIRDENLLYTILHAHCVEQYGPNGFEITYGEILQGKQVSPVAGPGMKSDYQRDFSERTYANEKVTMECIEKGNYKGAEAAIKRLETHGAESRSANTLRNFKNYAIVFNTLCRVAARDGGAPAWEIDQLSRRCSLEIENMASAPELISLREEMLKEYCRIVREAAGETYSALIRKATDYIASDFADHITLESTAELLNVSAGYLSALFRKETGISFSEYVSDMRIRHAKYLLKDSGLPVAVIASECGIPDPNYFSRLFRQKENMTPLQYRRKNRK